MQAVPTIRPVAAPWRRHPLLAFSALTALGCLLLVRWLDRPLALLLHHHAAGAVSFFQWVTNKADAAFEATNVGGRPTLLMGMGLAYVVGRWLLRWRGATVFLLLILTQLSSVASAHLLKILTHRQRPTFLAGADVGGAFGSHASNWDSFPSSHTVLYWSLCWPLAVAFPRWRGPLLVVPALVALGRLVLGEHYLSDVWAAIWLVVAWAALWQRLRLAVGKRT